MTLGLVPSLILTVIIAIVATFFNAGVYRMEPLEKGIRPLTTAALPAWRRGSDRVKHTVLIHVVMDGKRHGGRDHLDVRAAASLA